jgi:CHAT domain-containing protein/tetratricopeptide (TPR) repeat protein
MMTDESSSRKGARLREILETFLRADEDTARLILAEQGEFLLSTAACTLLQHQINELTSTLDTLKQRLGWLEELRPQWEPRQQPSPTAHVAQSTPEASRLPSEMEAFLQQLSAEQLQAFIKRLQSLSTLEQTQLLQQAEQNERLDNAQKSLLQQALQQIKCLSADERAQIVTLASSLPPSLLADIGHTFGRTVQAAAAVEDLAQTPQTPHEEEHISPEGGAAEVEDEAALEALLVEENWENIHQLLHTRPELLADTTLMTLRRRIATTKATSAIGQREQRELLLSLLETARTHGVDSAYLQLRAELQTSLQVVQLLMQTDTAADLSTHFAEHREVMLARATFALLYNTVSGHRNHPEVIRRSEERLRWLDALRTAARQKSQQRPPAQQPGTLFQPPAHAQMFDPATFSLVRCAQVFLPDEQERLALFPLLQECDRLTRFEEMARRSDLLTHAIGRVSHRQAPLFRAILYSTRASTHQKNVGGDMLQSRELALADYTQALRVLTPQTLLPAWMQAMQGRAAIYVERLAGDQHANIELALADLAAVLAHVSREHQAVEWALLHVSRGNAYQRRLAGDLQQNSHQALDDYTTALSILTRERAPQQWAATLLMRGKAHCHALVGDRIQHLEQAIADYNDALTIFTPARAPLPWASTLADRAEAYMNRTQGEREENVEQALADYNAVLTIATRTQLPLLWAQAIQGRGLAHCARSKGKARDNITQALADLNAALTVFTREQMPANWAIARMERGNIYQHAGEEDQEQNLQRALADYEAALTIITHQQYPLQWASLLWHRGNAYTRQITGDRKRNIELALQDFAQAGTVLSAQTTPLLWGGLLISRGQAYRQRLAGDPQQNLRAAIADFTTALTVVTRENMPSEWAAAHLGRGQACIDSRLPERDTYIEQALRDSEAALTYIHAENSPHDWLELILLQVAASTGRFAGDRGQNIEKALVNIERALSILRVEKNPETWARFHACRALAYLGRVIGKRQANLRQAIADCNAALTIFSADTAYEAWSMLVSLRAQASAMLNDIPYGQAPNEVQQRSLDDARTDLAAALSTLTPQRDSTMWALTHALQARLLLEDVSGDRVQQLHRALASYETALSVLSPEHSPFDWALIRSSRGGTYLSGAILMEPREAWITQGLADLEAATTVLTRTAIPVAYAGIHTMKAFAFLHMGRWSDAHNALMEAREAQRDQVNVAMTDASRAALIANVAQNDIYVRDALCMMRFEPPDIAGAVIALEEGRAQSLRVALDLDSIHPAQDCNAAARERIETFIAARTIWQEKQFQFTQPFPAEKSKAEVARYKEQLAQELDEAYATFTRARDAIRQYDDPDFLVPMPTLDGIARAVAQRGEALVYLVADETGMACIVKLDIHDIPEFHHIPLPHLTKQALMPLLTGYHTSATRIAVADSVQRLGTLGLNTLAAYLRKEGIHTLILVPYGLLGLFPLPAVSIQLPDGRKDCLNNLFTVTCAPSARAAEIAWQRAHSTDHQRKTLLLAGNPQPSVAVPLIFAEAEVETIRRIAQHYAFPARDIEYIPPGEATKERVVQALARAREAHLALHGIYYIDEPRRSQLILAGTEPQEEERTISLQEVLAGTISISGLRLLTLSACETSLIDVQSVPDEVVSLAAGFLQAGAAGVIASLWPVDDYASFLLMTRFALLYLDPQGTWSAARALAEAQRWLREEATNHVLATDEIVQAVAASMPDGVRNLYTTTQAAQQEQAAAQLHTAPDDLPYADPVYWAAFTFTGW